MCKQRIICLKFNDKTFDVEKGKYFHTIISSIIHYLKSPLIEIKEIASLISAIGDLSKKQNEFLNKIKYLIEEIQGSVSKLLSVNKIDQGNFVEINKFSINEIIENVAKIYVPLTQQKQITLNTPKSDQDQVLIDENLLKHALLNILEFSIKETHMGGTIEVIHKTDLENHYIVITDSGKGISNFDVKKLLDAKFTDQKRNELEIARGIMEILCGDLLIESNLGSGTAISLVFPWKH